MAQVALYLAATLLLLLWSLKPESRAIKRAGLTLLGLGFFASIYLLFSGKGGVASATAAALVGVFYFLLLKFRRLSVVRFAPVVSSLALLLSLADLKEKPVAGGPAVLIHVLIGSAAFGLLIVSAAASLLRRLAESRLKGGEISLPLGVPLSLWVGVERISFFLGFVFLTLYLVVSFIWSNLEGETARDLRTIGTVFLWLYYAILFHLERFGISPFKERFYLFNALGALAALGLLLFTEHSFS